MNILSTFICLGTKLKNIDLNNINFIEKYMGLLEQLYTKDYIESLTKLQLVNSLIDEIGINTFFEENTDFICDGQEYEDLDDYNIGIPIQKILEEKEYQNVLIKDLKSIVANKINNQLGTNLRTKDIIYFENIY